MSVWEDSSTGRLEAVGSPQPSASVESSDRLAMVPELLRLAAARTDAFVAELRRMLTAAPEMAPADDAAVGDLRVARELRLTYGAWVHGLDVLVSDARLTGARLAATATEARDREIGDGFSSGLDTSPMSDPAWSSVTGTASATPARRTG